MLRGVHIKGSGSACKAGALPTGLHPHVHASARTSYAHTDGADYGSRTRLDCLEDNHLTARPSPQTVRAAAGSTTGKTPPSRRCSGPARNSIRIVRELRLPARRTPTKGGHEAKNCTTTKSPVSFAADRASVYFLAGEIRYPSPASPGPRASIASGFPN